MKIYKVLGALAAAVAALALTLPLVMPVQAQYAPAASVQAITPLSRDILVSTFSSQVAGTVVSADQSGYNVSRIYCVYKASATTGSPSVTVTIMNKDAASGAYVTVLTSSAVTNTVATPLSVGAGVPATANVSAGIPVAKTWRVSTVFAGSGSPHVNGTIGCSVQ